MNDSKMEVRRVDKKTCEIVVSHKHYSRTLGIFWDGFGLYKDDVLIGICCFGQPSPAIQKHAFKNRDFKLYELTRLVIDSGHKNAASFLISSSMKMLKEKQCALISYADSAHGHSGIVYQSTNWLYTGSTVSHDSLYLIDGKPTHPMTIRDKFGVTEIANWAKQNKISKIKPSPKHRYFFFKGSKLQKKKMRESLSYKVIGEYPKSEKTTYNSGDLSCAEYYSLYHKS
jgi:hypothetical protein